MKMDETKNPKGGRKPGQRNEKRSLPQNLEIALLRLPEVLQLVPVSRSTWLSGVRSGRFPAPVRPGGEASRTVCWRGADILKITRG